MPKIFKKIVFFLFWAFSLCANHEIIFHFENLSDVSLSKDEKELLLTFQTKLSEESRSLLLDKVQPFIQSYDFAWNTLFFRVKEEVLLSFQKNEKSLLLSFKGASENLSIDDSQAKLTLARLYLAKRDFEKVDQILDEVLQKSPQRQVLEAESHYARYKHQRALKTLLEAIEKYPENEDLQKRYQDFALNHRRHLVFESLLQRHETAVLQKHSIKAFIPFQEKLLFALHFSLEAEQIRSHIHQFLHPQGPERGFKGQRETYTLRAHYHFKESREIQWALAASEGVLGSSLQYEKGDAKGKSTFFLGYKMPHSDFFQTLAAEGAMDQLKIARFERLSRKFAANLEIKGQRYHLDLQKSTANSVGFLASLYYFFRVENPSCNIGYVFDAEYVGSKKTLQYLGQDYFPLPLSSREFHTLVLETHQQYQRWLFRALAGASVDRLGSFGGSFLLSARYDFFAKLFFLLEYRQSLSLAAESSRVQEARASLSWYF